jgi:hypothetical protein
VTIEQIKGLLADHATEVKNGVFADLRRSGYFGGKGKEPEGQKEPKDPKPATTGDDVKQLMARQRAFDRATATAKLSDRALARMESAFTAESPENVSEWVKGYLEDLGIGASGASSPPQSATSPNPPPAAPASASPGAPATAPSSPPAPPAPAPVPVADLERAKVHPNKLTADQVSRLGPKGVSDYVNKFFREQGNG